MIRDILLTQKRELEERRNEQYIERNIALDLSGPLIKVIIGPRRSGKSFFAIKSLFSAGNFGYANFDDETLISLKDYNEIVAELKSIYGNPKIILFDEIQNLPRWELFVNRLQRLGFIIILTGSNANLLAKELATHLTGRHIPTYLFPFSFSEYASVSKKELTTAEYKSMLEEYLLHGGYPEPTTKTLNYKEYLSVLFDSIIYKDIVRRYKIRLPHYVDSLASYLISNTATENSFHSLAKATGIKSPNSVRKYAGYLAEAFLVFTIPRFSFKLREQLSSNQKVYCYDNGFIFAKSFSSSPNTGRLYENVIASELKKAELAGHLNVFYWKNQQNEEVDFVVRRGLKIEFLIQSCFDIRDSKTKEREIRALLKAGKEFKCDNLIIINSEKEGSEDFEWFGMKGTVTFIPLWKWLLHLSW